MFYRLIRTDLKRIAHYGIYMVVAAFVMMTVFLCLALNANSFIYSDDRSEPLSIGIVMSADSKTAQMAYNTISDMDSYRSSCVFTEFSDKDTALSRLSDGDLFAVIYVPDNIISDIMDGTNTPVEVYYSDNRSIDTFVLNDLFRSTSSMLGISQAAIYSVQAIGRNMELPEDIQDTLSNDVNAMFMTKVLDRTANRLLHKCGGSSHDDAVQRCFLPIPARPPSLLHNKAQVTGNWQSQTQCQQFHIHVHMAVYPLYNCIHGSRPGITVYR